jgi:hypothetical protein
MIFNLKALFGGRSLKPEGLVLKTRRGGPEAERSFLFVSL